MKYIKTKISDFLNESWYHGTPDSREIDQSRSFSEFETSVEYINDIESYDKLMEEISKSRNNDEELYFSLLQKVSMYKNTYKYIKPVFLTDVYSVAKTYADSSRAFDYQNSIEKIYEVDVNCDKIVKIDAYGERFRFIDVNKVKDGFIKFGISEKEIDNVIRMFNFYVKDNSGIKTDVIAAIGNYFKVDCIDVIGVLDSYQGGNTKSTVRMVLNPSKIKILK